MVHMYEAIVISKIFMQVLEPKSHKDINATMYYHFSFPGMKENMYISNNHLYNLQSIAELSKVSSSKVLSHISENDIFR